MSFGKGSLISLFDLQWGSRIRVCVCGRGGACVCCEGSVSVHCLRWHWVALGFTLYDDGVISGVDDVVLHWLFDYGGGLLHCGTSRHKATAYTHTIQVDTLRYTHCSNIYINPKPQTALNPLLLSITKSLNELCWRRRRRYFSPQ